MLIGLTRPENGNSPTFSQENPKRKRPHEKYNTRRHPRLHHTARFYRHLVYRHLDDGWRNRGPGPGPLFTVVRKGDHVTQDGLTAQTVYDVLARRADQAGVKKFSPHDLRRTFAGDLLDAGADLATVQKLMGHANANTTAAYDRRDAKAKKAAVNKLHIPYRKA